MTGGINMKQRITSFDTFRAIAAFIIVFLHYPPVSLTKDCEPIFEVLKKNEIKRCYYGHLHGGATKFALNGEKNGVNFRLISADYLEFCPFLISLD